ncbi:MAG: biotin-dependent carboxyltransferase [Deltaproteobacteria bacterium]|nr:biotin-dependent carboxyltransferase [Deltaproteobacteria bacterium]
MAIENVLKVITPGPMTTIQDLGRLGLGRYGVASSGALDARALASGNYLAGNQNDAAGLEITLAGFKAEALRTIAVAITGGDLSAHLNGRSIPPWQSLIMEPGDKIHFRARRTGCRAYLTVGGGLAAPPILGSRSTNISAEFGGLAGRSLKKGDLLSAEILSRSLTATAACTLPSEMIPAYGPPWTIRVILGPQDEQFTPEGLAVFGRAVYQVTSEVDRTGIRLVGPAISRRREYPESVWSEGLIPGVIQVPGDGQPIIILNETVTGGYRKIAAVISADLYMLGQLYPGDLIGFKPVSRLEAKKSLQDSQPADNL